MNNLFVGYNNTERFRILICADDMNDASRIADEYALDSGFDGEFVISLFEKKQ